MASGRRVRKKIKALRVRYEKGVIRSIKAVNDFNEMVKQTDAKLSQHMILTHYHYIQTHGKLINFMQMLN